MKSAKKKTPEPDNFSEYWIEMLKNREGEEQFRERVANTKKVTQKIVKNFIRDFKKVEREVKALRKKYRKYYLTRRVKKFARICTAQKTIFIPHDEHDNLLVKHNKYVQELQSKYKFITQLEIK